MMVPTTDIPRCTCCGSGMIAYPKNTGKYALGDTQIIDGVPKVLSQMVWTKIGPDTPSVAMPVITIPSHIKTFRATAGENYLLVEVNGVRINLPPRSRISVKDDTLVIDGPKD